MASLGTGDYEVLVRLDADDESDYSGLVTHDKVTTVLTKPRGNGYADLHLMVNDLCALASGEWLMLWNDDAIMHTEGWVELVEDNDPSEPIVLAPGLYGGMNLFPVISRAWYEVTGHFSLDPHNDSWVSDIAVALCAQRVLDIDVEHIREQMHDETYRQSQSMVAITSPGYFSEEKVRLRDEDTAKLREALG